MLKILRKQDPLPEGHPVERDNFSVLEMVALNSVHVLISLWLWPCQAKRKTKSRESEELTERLIPSNAP